MSDRITLRPLDEIDHDAVANWLDAHLRAHLRWWSEATAGESWSDEAIEAHLKTHDLAGTEWRNLLRARDNPESFVRVAHRGKTAVGLVWARIHTDRYLRTPTGVISWIATEPTHRRQGIATLLLEAADSWMAWHQVTARELHVTDPNTPAIALYEARGYRIVDHRMLAGPPSTE